MISHSKPTIGVEDLTAVIDCLASGMVAEGAATAKLEGSLSERLALSGAVATGSGTQALLIALKSLRGASGGEVIAPTYCCFDVVTAIEEAGLFPRLVDVGSDFLIDVDAAGRAVTDRTRAIISPHLLGQYADARPLQRFGIPVIEDYAQRIPEPGDLTQELGIMSFGGTKMLTCGEGGCVLVRQRELLDRLREMKWSIGAQQKRNFYCMSDLQANLAMAQLMRSRDFIDRRRKLAVLYSTSFSGNQRIKCPPPGERNQYYRFVVQLIDSSPDAVNEVIAHFASNGVTLRRPVDPLIHHLMNGRAAYPMAEKLYGLSVSLPIYPSLPEIDADRIAHMLLDWVHSRG